jgi:voltage-gated potassium channel
MASSLRILIYIGMIAVVFIIGITGTYLIGHYENGFSVPINSVFTAAYFTVITISTIGYGDIVPVTSLARLFVMLLIIVGLGVFLSAITFVSSEFVNSRVSNLTGKLNPFEKRMMKDHVILVGSDSVNLRMAEKLKEKNIRFVLISSNKEIVEQLRAEEGYKAFVAEETDEEALRQFEFGKAKSIIIDMRDKSHMVYAILLIRNLTEKSKIVAIARSQEEERHIRSMGAGIGIISPSEMVSKILTQKIEELKD